ncbi:hypothetical protein Tco_0814546 [Tanacetum coccineum]
MGMGGNNEGSKQGRITYYQTKKGDEQFELHKAKVVKSKDTTESKHRDSGSTSSRSGRSGTNVMLEVVSLGCTWKNNRKMEQFILEQALMEQVFIEQVLHQRHLMELQQLTQIGIILHLKGYEQFELEKAEVVKVFLRFGHGVWPTSLSEEYLSFNLPLPLHKPHIEKKKESKDTTESKHRDSGSTSSHSGRSGTNGYAGCGGSS